MEERDSDAEVVASHVAQRWLRQYGQRARSWLDEVPALAHGCAKRWNLELGPPLDGGSVNVVLSAETTGEPVVLKLAAPWSCTSGHEAEALRAWDGIGAARLLEASDDRRALLLERVNPGTPATGLSARQLAGLLEHLSRPVVPPGIPSLSEAIELRFDRATENRHKLLSDRQVGRARSAALELARLTREPLTLCHGDLLSKNILISDKRGLLAIDPLPCAGPVGFDAALWAATEPPIADAAERAAAVARLLCIPTNAVVGWVGVLLAVEACLASITRAEMSLELAEQLGQDWLRA